MASPPPPARAGRFSAWSWRTPLPLGDYRLTVRSTVASALHDTAGLRLDGDADGDEGPGDVRAFTVLPYNQALVAEADGPDWIDVGKDLALDGIGSSDPDAGCGDSLVSYGATRMPTAATYSWAWRRPCRARPLPVCRSRACRSPCGSA